MCSGVLVCSGISMNRETTATRVTAKPFGNGSFRPILVGRFGLIFSNHVPANYGEINIYGANWGS